MFRVSCRMCRMRIRSVLSMYYHSRWVTLQVRQASTHPFLRRGNQRWIWSCILVRGVWKTIRSNGIGSTHAMNVAPLSTFDAYSDPLFLWSLVPSSVSYIKVDMSKSSAAVVTLENVATYVVTFAQVPSTTKATTIVGRRSFQFLFALGSV